jgi:hypothetical protein
MTIIPGDRTAYCCPVNYADECLPCADEDRSGDVLGSGRRANDCPSLLVNRRRGPDLAPKPRAGEKRAREDATRLMLLVWRMVMRSVAPRKAQPGSGAERPAVQNPAGVPQTGGISPSGAWHAIDDARRPVAVDAGSKQKCREPHRSLG